MRIFITIDNLRTGLGPVGMMKNVTSQVTINKMTKHDDCSTCSSELTKFGVALKGEPK